MIQGLADSEAIGTHQTTLTSRGSSPMQCKQTLRHKPRSWRKRILPIHAEQSEQEQCKRNVISATKQKSQRSGHEHHDEDSRLGELKINAHSVHDENLWRRKVED